MQLARSLVNLTIIISYRRKQINNSKFNNEFIASSKVEFVVAAVADVATTLIQSAGPL